VSILILKKNVSRILILIVFGTRGDPKVRSLHWSWTT